MNKRKTASFLGESKDLISDTNNLIKKSLDENAKSESDNANLKDYMLKTRNLLNKNK